MEAIHDFFSGGTIPVKPIPENQQTFHFGGGWGDNIQVFGDWPIDSELLKVVGWKNPMPKEKDILLIPMQSGQTLKCAFVKINYCGDPADMFFADVKAIEYVEPPPPKKIQTGKFL